jgi:acyl dehydratase
MITVPHLTALQDYVGKSLGTTDWKTISQEMIDDFARATQDFQWIHEDTERTRRESPFGGPIAHGFLTLSLVSKFIEELLSVQSAKMGVNYGLNKVRFTSHVPAGSRVRLQVTLAALDPVDQGARLTFACIMEKESGDRPACVVEFIGLIVE